MAVSIEMATLYFLYSYSCMQQMSANHIINYMYMCDGAQPG